MKVFFYYRSVACFVLKALRKEKKTQQNTFLPYNFLAVFCNFGHYIVGLAS